MKSNTRARTTASTQDHLEVKEVLDDLVITKTGTISLVVQTTSVNFDLLSEFEQDSKIMAFAGMLNSLNFHIQVMIRTKRIDISTYVNYLKSQQQKQMSEGLKKQLDIYTMFIQNLIVQNDVLDKKFYIVIPYNPTNMLSNEGSVKAGSSTELINYERVVEQGKIFLYPKRDHILKQLGRMGLTGHQLTTPELIEIFYDIYNPEE